MNVVFFDLRKETILIFPLNVGFSNEKMAIRQNDLDINKLCTLWVISRLALPRATHCVLR